MVTTHKSTSGLQRLMRLLHMWINWPTLRLSIQRRRKKKKEKILPLAIRKKKLREQKINKGFKTLSAFSTVIAMLFDYGKELFSREVMMGGNITMDTDLTPDFNSHSHGFIRRHKLLQRRLLIDAAKGMLRCFLKSVPTKIHSFIKRRPLDAISPDSWSYGRIRIVLRSKSGKIRQFWLYLIQEVPKLDTSEGLATILRPTLK